VIFKREVTSVDAMGNPLTIAGPTTPTSETFTYDSERHYLTSATTGSGSGRPYGSHAYTYGKGALGVRMEDSLTFPGGTGHYEFESTYASGSARETEKLEKYFNASNVHQPMYDKKDVQTYTASGAMETMTRYRRPEGETTGWVQDGDPVTLTVDVEGRHTQLISTSTYDHRWLRMKREFDGAITEFWHGSGGQLLAERECGSACSGNEPLQEYVWLDGAPVAMIESELGDTGAPDDTPYAAKFIHVGLLGEPRRVTTTDKTIRWTRDMAPFGFDGDQGDNQQTVSGVTTTLNLGLPGQYMDPEGAHYNWHRFYLAMSGAYAEADPLVAHGYDALDSFAYSTNLPNVFVDSDGLRVQAFSEFLGSAHGVGSVGHHTYIIVSCEECSGGGALLVSPTRIEIGGAKNGEKPPLRINPVGQQSIGATDVEVIFSLSSPAILTGQFAAQIGWWRFHSKGCAVETCILAAARSVYGRHTGYHYLDNNSNRYAAQVLKECGILVDSAFVTAFGIDL